MKIEWDSRYSVGVRELDIQHQQIVKYINILTDGMAKGRGKEVTKKILDELSVYFMNHCTLEESYMENAGYNQVEVHKKVHAEMEHNLQILKNKFDEGDFFVSILLKKFLLDKFHNHILKLDHDYSACLKENLFKVKKQD